MMYCEKDAADVLEACRVFDRVDTLAGRAVGVMSGVCALDVCFRPGWRPVARLLEPDGSIVAVETCVDGDARIWLAGLAVSWVRVKRAEAVWRDTGTMLHPDGAAEARGWHRVMMDGMPMLRHEAMRHLIRVEPASDGTMVVSKDGTMMTVPPEALPVRLETLMGEDSR